MLNSTPKSQTFWEVRWLSIKITAAQPFRNCSGGETHTAGPEHGRNPPLLKPPAESPATPAVAEEKETYPAPNCPPGMEIFSMLGSNIQALSESDDLAWCFNALSYSLDSLNLCNKVSEAEHLLFCLNGSVQKTFLYAFSRPD